MARTATAARRNLDLKIICVNNFTYAMTGGQTAPTTPLGSNTATAQFGSYDPPFNLVNLMDAAGAVYVARWTTYHVKQLTRSMKEVLNKRGFGFIEILSPCPVLFQRRNKLGDSVDAMRIYKERGKVRHGLPTAEAVLTPGGEIAVGKLVDRDRPDYLDLMHRQLAESLGERYAVEGAPVCV